MNSFAIGTLKENRFESSVWVIVLERTWSETKRTLDVRAGRPDCTYRKLRGAHDFDRTEKSLRGQI